MLTATRSCSGLLAPACVETVTGPDVAVSGTRAMTNSLVLTTTEPPASPKRTFGRWRSRGFRPEPTMRTSPPGSAAVGSSALICGCPLTFFFPTERLAEPIVPRLLQNREMQQKLHHSQCIQPRTEVIDDNSGSIWQPFQAPDGKRLSDVEC